jgi:hypothetical protein
MKQRQNKRLRTAQVHEILFDRGNKRKENMRAYLWIDEAEEGRFRLNRSAGLRPPEVFRNGPSAFHQCQDPIESAK